MGFRLYINIWPIFSYVYISGPVSSLFCTIADCPSQEIGAHSHTTTPANTRPNSPNRHTNPSIVPPISPAHTTLNPTNSKPNPPNSKPNPPTSSTHSTLSERLVQHAKRKQTDLSNNKPKKSAQKSDQRELANQKTKQECDNIYRKIYKKREFRRQVSLGFDVVAAADKPEVIEVDDSSINTESVAEDRLDTDLNIVDSMCT